jgi:perosamine synthetase
VTVTLDLTGRRWPPPPTPAVTTAVTTALTSQVWTDGPFTADVEQRMTALTGARHCVAFNSCTTAIQAALAAADPVHIRRVAVPTLAFTGTITGAVHRGHSIDFRDVNPDTLTMDRWPPWQNGLVIAVDLHGVPHTLDRALTITDACQAIGTRQAGVHIGATGTHCWSFSSAKLVAAPDGGAVTTSSTPLAERLRVLRDYGTHPTTEPGRSNALVFRRDGHNWRPSELSMAIVAARLDVLLNAPDGPSLTGLAAHTSRRLHDALDGAGLWRQQPTPGSSPCWHKIRIGPAAGPDRYARAIAMRTYLHQHDVPTHAWGRWPLHQHPAYRTGTALPHAEAAAAATFCLGTEQCPPLTWTDPELDQVGTILHTMAKEIL